MVAVKPLLNRHFHLIFVGLFFTLSGCLLFAPPIWDEPVYLKLANHALSNPFQPFHPMLGWVPHPPLLWYLMAVFHPVPRMAPLFISAFGILFLFYACKRLYGMEVAKLSVAVLVSTVSYLLYSLVMFPDGPVMTFMAQAVLSLLCWTKLGDRKFLWFSGLGLALASMTDYTSIPVLSVTLFVWLVILRRRFDRRSLFSFFGVMAASLLPLALWGYRLSLYLKSGENLVYHYFSVYDIFPSSWLSRLMFNLPLFAPVPLLFCGLPLLSWARKRPFDSDSKLLLIYSAIIPLFFCFITPEYAIETGPPYFRYSLPMIPAFSVISARSLAKEKTSIRFLILCFQFLYASCISLATLL